MEEGQDVEGSSGNSGWMGSVGDQIASLRLWELILPGTHDSCTHMITPAADFSPEAPGAIRKAPKKLVARWAKAQNMSTLEQLRAGIRYLDLRIACNPSDGDLWTCHSLYSQRIEEVLREIKQFIKEESKEIILLDFNHLYNMTDESHQKLIKLIAKILRKKRMVFKDGGGCEVTLRELWSQGERRIVVIYHDWEWAERYPFLWHGKDSIASPWPDTTDIRRLKDRLERNLKQRKEEVAKLSNSKQEAETEEAGGKNGRIGFFVLQGILTPDANLILKNLRKGSLVRLAAKVNPHVLQWVEEEWVEEYQDCYNILIVDHFHDTRIVELAKQLTVAKSNKRREQRTKKRENKKRKKKNKKEKDTTLAT